VFERTLSLAGGRRAIVAVVPQTYPSDAIADAAVELWQSFHAREVVKVSRTEPAAARDVLGRATLIWIPGGFPGFLMHAIQGTAILSIIHDRFEAGVIIGGASAGAAVMSRTMIADETTPDGDSIAGPQTEDGLGLWPEAIVSPHFTERLRFNALLAIVRAHPDTFGVGIDEGTAAFVSNGAVDVLGRGTVVIVDARDSNVRTLRSGMRYRYPVCCIDE
jgi:cyanophycinase